MYDGETTSGTQPGFDYAGSDQHKRISDLLDLNAQLYWPDSTFYVKPHQCFVYAILQALCLIEAIENEPSTHCGSGDEALLMSGKPHPLLPLWDLSQDAHTPMGQPWEVAAFKLSWFMCKHPSLTHLQPWSAIMIGDWDMWMCEAGEINNRNTFTCVHELTVPRTDVVHTALPADWDC